ncbi:permease [Paenibacillus sp. GP183]|uniref:permease n=1 Tax=Paenibacillus sp. GP183 TaxID=1882751 RepID=UPI00089BFF9E|nr:permease [Paenibacillus sp. GP183]SED09000.1 hypothetical protein SAMN05443246_5661 [Paenibacillus sp. GP183]
MQVSIKRNSYMSTILPLAAPAIMIGLAVLIIKMYTNSTSSSEFLSTFKTLFISIILEALPFMMLGVLFSSILQVFVSERTVQRFIPRDPLLAVMFACVLGFVFPICECGLTPVVRRLMHKGMPLYVAIVFILAGPIINPVVFFSTYMAFRTEPGMAYTRLILAFFIACIIGLIVYKFIKTNPLRAESKSSWPKLKKSVVKHVNKPIRIQRKTFTNMIRVRHGINPNDPNHGENRFTDVLSHAGEEFFEMGKYLLIGSLITAFIQVLVSRENLESLGTGYWSSHFFMMAYAYLLSLCSTSDAFVASSFVPIFSKGSLLTFMVFGPMLDLKGTIMLLSIFKSKFVLLLTVLILATVILIMPIGELPF